MISASRNLMIAGEPPGRMGPFAPNAGEKGPTIP